jgi:hydroxyethylthiazole kinase-like uncharacterized protein yjeF
MTRIARPVIVPPARDAHKYSRGMVVVVQGEMPGAAMLAARAAMHGGAGYVVLAGRAPDGPGPDALVRRRIDMLDSLLEDERVGALLIGPGLGDEPIWLAAAIASERPLVIDGDALTPSILEGITGRPAVTILTPHAGEFDRMFGPSAQPKAERTVAAAETTGAWIVHKGAETVITSPSGDVWTESNASPWLSTAGTGDVLAGLIAARLACSGAEGAPPEAVWLHTRIAELAGPAFIADDLIAHIPHAMAECLAN